MTDRERALKEAHKLSDEMGEIAEEFIVFQLHNPSPEYVFPRNRFAEKIAAALLEWQARGVEWAADNVDPRLPTTKAWYRRRAAKLRAQIRDER